MSLRKINLSSLNLPTLDTIILPEAVKGLIKTLKLEKNDVYIVGGFVRDLLLKRKSYDLDFIVVNKDSLELTSNLASELNGSWFVLDDETKTTRLVLKDENSLKYTFDFTPVSDALLENDFARRDFTVNTFAINLKNPDFVEDRFSAFDDLKEKILIRAVNLKNLLDDPIRFLRAFRFSAILNGAIESKTFDFIKDNLTCFNQEIASERIASELWKIFDYDLSFKTIIKISDSGLLEKIFPELSPMRKVPPNIYHHLWLYDHSLELVKTCEEKFISVPDWVANELLEQFSSAESPRKIGIVKFACMLHDLGKPGTWEIKKINGEEKHTFYGHDKLGEEITDRICERLKLSNSIRDSAKKLVRYHLRPFQLSQNNAPITERALYRFFRDTDTDTTMLLMLAMADLYATVGPKVTDSDLKTGEKLILYLFEEYRKYRTETEEIASKPKLLDGNEIMKITGLKPSPEIGLILKDLDEAIAVGEIKTKEQAIHWLKEKIGK